MCIAKVSGAPSPSRFNENYVGGGRTDFALECPCSEHKFGVQIRGEVVCAALGYDQKYNFFGYANGAGFAMIGEAAFQALKNKFHQEYLSRFEEEL
jgi:hypothetical protein